MRFEKTRFHFKSDFFAAVAVVDAKRLPSSILPEQQVRSLLAPSLW